MVYNKLNKNLSKPYILGLLQDYGCFSRIRGKTPSFKVEIEEMTSRVGFSFSQDGWHPFVKTLQEYEKNPDLRYQDSTLARLYQSYKPQNIQEVLLDHIEAPLSPVCFWPPNNELIKKIWILNKNKLKKTLEEVNNKKNQGKGWIYFGPHTNDYGEREFSRMKTVYDSLKIRGYQPDYKNTDPVNGFFLQKGSKTRFILMQGNHRVSALKALGYSRIEVVTRPGHPKVINWKDLNKLTEGEGGIYSDYIIKELFLALFEGSGLEKARRYQLI